MDWYVLHLNPEPWAVGPLSVGRRKGGVYPAMGQNAQLHAYQEAVKDEMRLKQPTPWSGKMKLTFYFWRQQIAYATPLQRQHRKHEADATNLQKALEDALQGVLYDNDKDTSDIRSVIVEQGPDVVPCIVISIDRYAEPEAYELPDYVIEQVRYPPAYLQIEED